MDFYVDTFFVGFVVGLGLGVGIEVIKVIAKWLDRII